MHPSGRSGRDRVTRREFVRRSLVLTGAAAAVPVARARAQNPAPSDIVGVGFIGIGIRGEILVRTTRDIPGARIVEVCDVYDGHFARAKELLGPEIRTGRDYRRLLDNRDVQAIVIATPDHWHKQMVLDALAAGKDVYIEKPMTYRWEDGPVMNAAAASGSRILQVGSQWQSMPANERAIELIRSGALGRVTLVTGTINRNTPSGAWYYPVAPDASPATIDWDRFLGPAPKVPFDARRFFQWRLFWDYSGGLPTDLFVHMITAAHTLMGVRMADRVTGVGGIYHWKDREVPDQMSAIVEYPEGFTLNLTATANNAHTFPLLTIMGTDGTLEYHGTRLVYHKEPVLENYSYSTMAWPKAAREAFAAAHDVDPASMRPRATAGVTKPAAEEIETTGPESTTAHLTKFYDSVRTRTKPVEDGEMGHLCAAVGHMVNISHKLRKPVTWNRAAGAVVV